MRRPADRTGGTTTHVRTQAELEDALATPVARIVVLPGPAPRDPLVIAGSAASDRSIHAGPSTAVLVAGVGVVVDVEGWASAERGAVVVAHDDARVTVETGGTAYAGRGANVRVRGGRVVATRDSSVAVADPDDLAEVIALSGALVATGGRAELVAEGKAAVLLGGRWRLHELHEVELSGVDSVFLVRAGA